MEFESDKISEKMPYLKMLILFGSRAINKVHNQSDWDFAVFLDQELSKNNIFIKIEIANILGDLLKINSDNIDVIILNNCSLLLAHNIAKDGKLILETEQEMFTNFKQKSILSEQKLTIIENQFKDKINNFLIEWGII